MTIDDKTRMAIEKTIRHWEARQVILGQYLEDATVRGDYSAITVSLMVLRAMLEQMEVQS